MVSGDTIAAIATAPGRGGVAVIRVSGPEAATIAARLTGKAVEPGRIALRRIAVDDDRGPSATIDEAVVLYFQAPRSYTGEDVVEFQCHGGAVTPRRVLEACLAAGARLARRGEFTQRALLNGKLDYDQAESVLDLIDAKTARAADAALAGLNGRRERTCRGLYERALSLSAELEHALDIDTEELPADFFVRVRAQADALRAELQRTLQRQREGHLLRRGAAVVLVGPPNAGKSSLMNALLETNRAIVSATPGTTRDSIEEWLDLDGWPIRLIDTAGLRYAADGETVGDVEAEGVRRAEQLRDSADIVLQLGDGSSSAPMDARTIAIHAKCDLGRGAGLNVSSVTGAGLPELKAAIVDKLQAQVADRARACAGDDSESDAAWRLNEVAMLFPGWDRIWSASTLDLVLAANVVRRLADELGKLVGMTYASDLLDRLFDRFCVGK